MHRSSAKLSSDIKTKRANENFPVASFLMPKAARDGVIIFYNFARHADDIADHTELPKQERYHSLVEIDHTLSGSHDNDVPDWIRSYMSLVGSGKLSARHGRDLLSAFIQDTMKERYESWDELIDYCMRSAAPVGRAVLELHGEGGAYIPASDALCNALQILNHLQDIKEDYMLRDRVYLPTPWLVDMGELAGDNASFTVKQAIDEALTGVDSLLDISEALPPSIKSWRLRLETSFILEIARALSRKLRRHDPIYSKVKLNKLEVLGCFLRGLKKSAAEGNVPQRYVNWQAKQSRSSFLLPLMTLGKRKRDAMLALYGFCRLADDAVDEAENAEEAARALAFWKKEVDTLYEENGEGTHLVTQALKPHVLRYHIPREPFDTMLEALSQDIEGVVKPTYAGLERYCYGVASCVGLLSIEIFGYKNARTKLFAEHLGKGMQLINILRDVHNDAAAGRIYLPREALEEVGLGDIDPAHLHVPTDTQKQQLRKVFYQLEIKAREHFSLAKENLAKEDRRAMRPALLMQRVYLTYLSRMEAHNWNFSRKSLKFGWFDKLKLLAGMFAA